MHIHYYTRPHTNIRRSRREKKIRQKRTAHMLSPCARIFTEHTLNNFCSALYDGGDGAQLQWKSLRKSKIAVMPSHVRAHTGHWALSALSRQWSIRRSSTHCNPVVALFQWIRQWRWRRRRRKRFKFRYISLWLAFIFFFALWKFMSQTNRLTDRRAASRKWWNWPRRTSYVCDFRPDKIQKKYYISKRNFAGEDCFFSVFFFSMWKMK